MRAVRVLVVATSLVLGVSCSSGDDDDTPPTTISFEPVQDTSYDEAFDECGASTPTELMEQLGTTNEHPLVLAGAYAEAHDATFLSPTYQGCMDALIGQPHSP